MATDFFKKWMSSTRPFDEDHDLQVWTVRRGARDSVQKAIREAVADHLANVEIIEQMGGYPGALSYIRNKLPSSKQVRSGDFGEVLATEYIDQCTNYWVPIKRLRYKDDRNMAMRGDDVLALRQDDTTTKVLKTEAKSRAKLAKKVVLSAGSMLVKHSARPNPSTLAFISSRLREQGQVAKAKIVEQLQKKTPSTVDVEHLLFTVSGNDPGKCLRQYGRVKQGACRRLLVGCVVQDHQQFIHGLFADLHDGRDK